MSVLSEILDMRASKQVNKIWHTSSEKYWQRHQHLKYVAKNIYYLIQRLRLWYDRSSSATYS